MSCSAFVVAIVGAESTGKSTLARQLHDALRGEGAKVALVGEYLREFCAMRQRTPLRDEQAAIAARQTNDIRAAARDHDWVIADTSALMIAVYSHFIFGDESLYPSALSAQSEYGLTLLTAFDLPWVADGLQRDGEQVREPVDTLLRAALQRGGIGFAVVSGSGSARLQVARQAIAAARRTPSGTAESAAAGTGWHTRCERCGSPACERRLLARG